jgi:hypothetical protein
MNMEQDNLTLLKKIKKVEASPQIFAQIEQRIKHNKANVLPLYQVGIAASLLIGVFIAQFVILNKSFSNSASQMNAVTELIETNNNTLYYE